MQNYHIILRTANKRPYFHELLTFFMHQKCRLSINTFKKQQNTSTLTTTVPKKIAETPLPSFIGFLSEKAGNTHYEYCQLLYISIKGITVLSFIKRLIIKLTKNVLISWTNDTTTLKVEFLDTMCCPAHNTSHCEDWSINLLWQTYHFIDKATIKIEVCTRRLTSSTMLLQTFDSLLLYQFQEIVLIFSTFSLASSPAKRFNSTARGSLNV